MLPKTRTREWAVGESGVSREDRSGREGADCIPIVAIGGPSSGRRVVKGGGGSSGRSRLQRGWLVWGEVDIFTWGDVGGEMGSWFNQLGLAVESEDDKREVICISCYPESVTLGVLVLAPATLMLGG